MLAVRCDVFKTLFEHEGMKEVKSNEMEIKDLTCNVVKEVLQYIYTIEAQS